MTTDVDMLWQTFQVNRDPRTRDRLIEMYMPYVEYEARRMLPGMHSSVEIHDLQSYGAFGLIDAVERFDPNAGVLFRTFATYRIQGAITDGLRSQAWEPRSVRARHRKVQQAQAAFEHQHGRLPTEIEVATAVGMTTDELRRLESDVAGARVHSLNQVATEDGRESQIDVPVQDGADLSPQMEHAAFRLAGGLGHLNEQDHLLLLMIYVMEVPLKEIAASLGVTESWVSHLHTKVMVRLQRTMAAQA